VGVKSGTESEKHGQNFRRVLSVLNMCVLNYDLGPVMVQR
jgi:hypothetical protein